MWDANLGRLRADLRQAQPFGEVSAMTQPVYTVAEAIAAGILPDKPKASPVQHERALAVEVAAELRKLRALGLLRGRFFHVGNERKDRLDAMLAHLMGVEAGVPDLIFVLEDGQGAAIELKRLGGGRLSKAQRDWRDDMRRLGWKWAEARAWAEVFDTLRSWGAIREGGRHAQGVREDP